MGLRMKNVNIVGVYRKIRLLRGGVHEKPVYRGEMPIRGGGLGQFADLRGAWRKRGGCVFKEVEG